MRYIILLLTGLILGGVLTFYFLVGAPRAKLVPSGRALRAPEAGGDPPGTAVLALDENFFNLLLGAVFHDLNAPSFRLARGTDGSGATVDSGVRFIQAQTGCSSQITILAEGSGVRTGVHLADGKITAPLAFSGSYNVPVVGCVSFRGWAQADIQLSFDEAKQTLYGQLNVEGVNVENAPPVVSDMVTGYVQHTLNERVNPLEVMRGTQLGLAVPVQASGGMLKAQVKDLRSEVKDGVLRLHITYDFSATRGGPQQTPSPAAAPS